MLDSCECKHPPLVKDVIQVIWLLFQQHQIETPLKNEASDVIVEVSTRIQDREGKVLYQISSPAEIAAGGKKVVIHTIEMFYPERWSVRNPYLYTAIVEVKVGNELMDSHQTTFGMHSLDSI